MEQTDDVSVVWLLSERKTSTVVQEFFVLIWEVFAKVIDRDLLLLFLDIGILFSFGSARKTLPRESSFEEVDQDMTYSLKIISSRLFVPDMSVDRSVSSCTREILTISERDVLPIGGFVTFGKTKINDINCILGLFSSSDHKVIWFYISMDDSLLVHHLNSLNHLN